MISSTGRYWATGIEVNWRADPGSEHRPAWQGWNGEIKFYDDGFANDRPLQGFVSTQGVLHTRYTVKTDDMARGLHIVATTLIADAERLGVEFKTGPVGPTICYTGDGEWKDYPAPDGWEKVIYAECKRLGWECGQYAHAARS